MFVFTLQDIVEFIIVLVAIFFFGGSAISIFFGNGKDKD